MPTYNQVPSVDENFMFTPKVRSAIATAPEMAKELDKRLPVRTSGGVDLNTLTVSEDIQFSSVTGMVNSPDTSIGALSVRTVGGVVSQVWKSTIKTPRQQWSRFKNGSNPWSDWKLESKLGPTISATVDLNKMIDIASYSVQSTSAIGLPIPKVGTLNVYPSTGQVVQEFISWEASPRTFKRRLISTDKWDSWVEVPSRDEFNRLSDKVDSVPPSLPSSGGGDTLATPIRAELAAYPPTTTSRDPSEIIFEMDTERVSGWNWSASSLSQTEDYGKTWRQLNDKDGSNPFYGAQVESVLYMDNDELAVSCVRGSAEASRREMWVTTNLRDDKTRIFTKTMTARAPGIKFTASWSQSTFGRILIVNEYGPKTGSDWAGLPVKSGENARYSYLSMDNGKSFKTIFDLNDYVTQVQGRPTSDTQHLHGVAWDPYWDRIWISFGDNSGGAGSNGVVYSDDLGETWKTAHFYSGPSAPNQVVGILPMPKCVLFGGDNGSPDILRIDRAHGKHKEGAYPMPIAFDSTAEGKHLLHSKRRVRRVGDDGPALFAFGAEGVPAPSFAVATMDGYTYKEIWRDPDNQPAGFGCRSIVGPTLTGKVIIGSTDKKVEGKYTEIILDAPGY